MTGVRTLNEANSPHTAIVNIEGGLGTLIENKDKILLNTLLPSYEEYLREFHTRRGLVEAQKIVAGERKKLGI